MSLRSDTASPATTAPQKSAARSWRFASWAPTVVLVLVCVAIGVINPSFLTIGNFVRISQAVMIPLVLGLGATFVILMGSVDMSVEGGLTLSAVIVSMLVLNGANANDLGLLVIPIVILIGAGVGFINGTIHVRFKVPSFMVTLGTWFICVGIANAILGGTATRINDQLIRAFAIARDPVVGLPWGVWTAVVCFLIALFIQNYTRLGRYIYALGGGEELAALSGIPAARVRVMAFTLAGVFYAIGGILAAAQLGNGNSMIGAGRLFTTITGVVLGGTALSGGQGGVQHTLVGVLIVVALSNGMVLMGIPPSVQVGVNGLMIIAAVSLSIDRKMMTIVK